MANPIRPDALPEAATVNPDSAIIVDDGVNVRKATPIKVVDAAIPLASQAEAEAGADNTNRMSSLRVKQAIDAQAATIEAVNNLKPYTDLTAFKAQDVANGAARLITVDGTVGYTWVPGSSGTPDDDNFIASTFPGAPAGNWEKQGAGTVATTQNGAGAISETVETVLRRSVWAESYGLSVGNTPAQNAAAIMAAVVSVRTNGTTLSTDGLNGGSFTAYTSGEILFGEGQFPVDSGVLRFVQDLGIIFRGKGSRKTNNSVKGRTALVFSGTGEYGIQAYGNGARGFVCQDMDLLYSDGFAGDILDNFGAPGMELQRVHIGTAGISGGTRESTARSLIRATYVEFIELLQVTFNGAIDGIWIDDLRQPDVGPPIEFGGSVSTFDRCVFYDITGSMIKHLGNRNFKRLTLTGCSFNPITMNCTYALNLTNIDALTVRGCIFTPSTSFKATSGWLKIVNCTGTISDNEFLGACAVGTISGNITFSTNVWDATVGPEIKGGIIRVWGGEAISGSSGYLIAPTIPLSAVLGPDRFSSSVDYSYDIPSDSANLDVNIHYTAVQDASTNRFRNTSARVTIAALARSKTTIPSTPYTVLKTDTGRVINLTAASAVANLPAVSNVGLRFTFFTNGTNTISIVAPAGTLMIGGGGGKTSMTSIGDSGVYTTVECFDGKWNVVERIGGFNYA